MGNIFLQVHKDKVIFCIHYCVILLHGTQLHSDNQLSLGRHVLEDVGLQSPQHVRPQKVMELLNLVLFGDVRKLLQEAIEVTEQKLETKTGNIT